MRHAGHNLSTTMESLLNVNYHSLTRVESETQSQSTWDARPEYVGLPFLG
jgi:hypothetical protein